MEDPIFDTSAIWSEAYSYICKDCAEKHDISKYNLRCFSIGDKKCGIVDCNHRALYEINVDDYEVEDFF